MSKEGGLAINFLTVRDAYAMAALQGILANKIIQETHANQVAKNDGDASNIARLNLALAFKHAEEAIKQKG